MTYTVNIPDRKAWWAAESNTTEWQNWLTDKVWCSWSFRRLPVCKSRYALGNVGGWDGTAVRIWATVLCLVVQSSPTLCKSMDCSLPVTSVHEDSPGEDIGVDCHALLQGIFPTQGLKPGLCRWILYHQSHQGSHNNYNKMQEEYGSERTKHLLQQKFSNIFRLSVP